MDAVHHLLRRSRLRSFASTAGHAFHIHETIVGLGAAAENDSSNQWTIEKRDAAELDERFYASLNQYSPEELSSLSAASSASAFSASKAAGEVSVQLPFGVYVLRVGRPQRKLCIPRQTEQRLELRPSERPSTPWLGAKPPRHRPMRRLYPCRPRLLRRSR